MATTDQSGPVIAHKNGADKVPEEIRTVEDAHATIPIREGPTSRPAVGASDKDFESMFEGYKIIGQIGEGAFGTVWRALQLSTQREVALKVLGMGIFGSEKARVRFEREVELTARLEHPNVARIYDSGLHRGAYYYTMELFEGEHLDKYVINHELTQREILELVHMVCRAVQYAHQRGVIHRDLKPSNIIVTGDGEPHILDFGLAKTFLEGDKTVTVSVDGDVAGTPAYMSPEQAAGRLDAIDTRTDVYSLGVILFNILTNEWPYDLSGSRFEILRNIQEQEPTRPSKIIPHFDADIEAILLKTLSKKPNERYQSSAELAHDIQCWLEGLPIVARSVDTLYLLRKLIARHRAASIIVGLLLIIIVSNSFVSLSFYSRTLAARKESESLRTMSVETAKTTLALANQAVFQLFLESWHDGKIVRAKGMVGFFAPESLERIAAEFLLDPRALNEKEADFREKLSADQPFFSEFIIGEYHLKNNDKPAAIEAYERCLGTGRDVSEVDDWFKNRANLKLSELLNKDMPARSCGPTSGGE
jgi:serine/threonine protein kinase